MNLKRAKWTIAAFLTVLLVLGFVALRVLPSRGVQKQLASIRAAALPASATELDVWYKAVPHKENQAVLILEAAKLRVEPAKGFDPTANLNVGDTISAEQESNLKAYLADNAPVLQLLRQAAQLRESRYPIDLTLGPNTLLPHLAQAKGMAQLLRAQAAEESHLGNVAGAVETVRDSFALAHSLATEPLLISDLVRISCTSIALPSLERLLSEHALSREQLSHLSQDVAEAEGIGPRALFRALVGERADGLSVFDLSFTELEQLGSSPQNVSDNPLRHVGYQAYRATGLLQRDLALYLEMMGGFADSARLEFPQILRQSERVEEQMTQRFSQGLSRFAIFSRMLLPAVSKTGQKEATLAARLRCAEVALAAEAFRAEHEGHLPDSLDQLSPAYLHTLPRDPFDGTALVYERLSDKGYRIVSPGATQDARNRSKKAEAVQFSVLR